MSNWEIKTETINDDYYWGEFGGFRVIVREEDGYINGTNLVKGAGKRFPHWTDNKQTKELIRETSRLTGIDVDELTDVVTGGRLTELRGTYLHPLLVTHLAWWCSPSFGAAAATWIEEWKEEDGNFKRYMEALSTMIPYTNDRPEEVVQQELAECLGCQREVVCVYGRIDLLSKSYLIEVKSCEDWMKGVGQLCCYGLEYPDHQRILYTYDGHLSGVQQRACRANQITVVSCQKEMHRLISDVAGKTG